MVNSNVTTLDLNGSETVVEFEKGYPYYFIRNDGNDNIYVSTFPNITPETEGVYTVPAGGTERIGSGYSLSKFYILGTGKAYIRGEQIAVPPSFKKGAKGGDKNISGAMGYIFKGLMCHYSADSKHFQQGWRIVDLSGNGNAGCFFEKTKRQPTYLTNAGNYINLSQRYIIMPQMDYEQITLEAVCSFPNTPSAEVDIISNLETGGYCIYYNRDKKEFITNIHIGGSYHTTTGIKNDNLVHLFTATYDNTTIKFYIDGVLIDEKQIVGDIDFPIADTVMGINVNPYGGNAEEDNLGIGTFNFYSARVYNRALSADEIVQNFLIDESLFFD